MDLNKQFEIAVAALRLLEECHANFMKAIEGLKTPKIEGAELAVVDGEIQAVCLGVQLRAIHRPLVREGYLQVVEYAFRAQHREQELVVYAMYLEANGNLYEDALGKNLICQSGNTSLTHRLAPRLGAALLQSDIFLPSKL